MGAVRRDFLKFAGGLSAGLVFTPVPWKVLDDVSIWTQNWNWIPRPLRGEITTRFTNCTLCPAACGVRAKCVAGQPYQLVGIANHPVGRPTLCPAGLAAHQLPYAPARIAGAVVNGKPASLEQALGAASETISNAKSVVILDGRPGRCTSALYRRTSWTYAVAPGCSGSLAGYAKLTGIEAGVDYDRARTILSFGAPVLHGWETPGRLLARRSGFRLIQVEPSQSRTAAFADEWLPVKPGSEDAVALAIARILLREQLVKPPTASDWQAYEALLSRIPTLTDIPEARLTEIARAVASGPSVVLGGSLAAAGLNVLLGDRAAIVHRGKAAGTPELADLRDGSAQVLVTDVAAAVPPAMIRRKLRPGGVLICLAAYTSDLTQAADILIPIPAWQEAREDVSAPPDAPVASFSIAEALLPASQGTITPANAVARLSGTSFSLDEAISARVGEIHKEAKGSLFRYGDGSTISISDMKADGFASALAEGACWVDEPRSCEHFTARMLGGLTADSYLASLAVSPPHDLLLEVSRGMAPVPMLPKLYQECDLYARGDVACVNPETAAARGIADGDAVRVRTRCGTGSPAVRLDPAVAPGVVQIDALPPPGGKGTAMRLCDDIASPPAELWRA